jgi:hypothetical protein
VASGSLLLAGWLALCSPAVSADAPTPLVIGVVPLRDEAEQPRLAARLSEMLAARLGARFEDVDFVAVDPALLGSGLSDGPLLLDEAVELGRLAGVDALLDGVFGGVQISGGSWPTRAASAPEARGKLRWRLVECAEGLLLADARIEGDKYKAYSQRIRTEDELQRRVLQDLVLEVGDELERAGVFSKAAPQTSEAAGDEDSDAGSLPLTPDDSGAGDDQDGAA